MKVGIVGSAIVGQVLGAKLASQGHDVVLGTRTPDDLEAKKGYAGSLGEWLGGPGKGARVATFSEAAKHGTLVINATSGVISLEALKLAGRENLAGKVLIDVSNMLDYSHGMPPTCLATDKVDGSMAEQIQKANPEAKVVKTFNMTSGYIMTDPGSLAGGDHTIFLCGNDREAKAAVTELLRSFGWRDIFDLGDLTAARAMEMSFALWARCWQSLGEFRFNFKLVR